jgi:hypothetical protein
MSAATGWSFGMGPALRERRVATATRLKEVNMNTPGFAAEASLYKTRQSYYGPHSRPAGDGDSTIVPQQSTSCLNRCFDELSACSLRCLGIGGSGSFLCSAGCLSQYFSCEDDCGGGGGGPPPPPPPPQCCPRNRPRCCGTCPPGGRCTGECIPLGASCP